MVFLFWKFAGRRQERLGKDVGKFLAVLPDLIKFWCFFFWGSLWHLRRACLCPQEAVKSIFNLMFRAITWFLTLALHYFLYFWNRHFCRHNSLLAYITSVIIGFQQVSAAYVNPCYAYSLNRGCVYSRGCCWWVSSMT